MDPKHPFAGLVQVRLTLDTLRHSILAVLPDHADAIRASIDHEVGRAVEAFDFEGEVRRAVGEVVREAMRRELQQAVASAFAGSPLRDMVSRAVMDAVREQLKPRRETP